MPPKRGALWSGSHTLGLFLVLGAIILAGLLSPEDVRHWAWVATLGLLGVFILLAGHGITGLWRGALIDPRNKMSLSRLQLVLWMVVVLSAFLLAALANIAAGDPDPLSISIPDELWMILGISTTSMVASPLVASTKKTKEPEMLEEAKTMDLLAKQGVDPAKLDSKGLVVSNQAPEEARWSDLFRGEETGNAAQLDLAKVQMFFFTFILVLAYAAALIDQFRNSEVIKELPALSATLVGLLGISHGGYLVNKAVPHSETT